MATGFKIDKKTGEPLHLVFSGEATVDDYVTDDDGNVTLVQTIIPATAPADDEWFPADIDAVIANMTAPLDERHGIEKLKARFPVMDVLDWEPAKSKGKK